MSIGESRGLNLPKFHFRDVSCLVLLQGVQSKRLIHTSLQQKMGKEARHLLALIGPHRSGTLKVQKDSEELDPKNDLSYCSRTSTKLVQPALSSLYKPMHALVLSIRTRPSVPHARRDKGTEDSRAYCGPRFDVGATYEGNEADTEIDE